MSLLMGYLGYEYVDPGSGYQEGRRTLESTQAHSRLFIPLLELLESHPELFVVVYYDESTPHLHQYRRQIWTKRVDISTAAERKVTSRLPGKGPSIHVSGAVGAEFGGFVQDEDGVHIGSFMEKQQAKASGEPVTENSDTFSATILAIVDRILQLFPERIPVVVMDSPAMHRKSEEKNNQRASSMSLQKLEVVLRQTGGWEKSMSKKDAAAAYSGSVAEYEAQLANLTDIEALLYDCGALVLFNLNSQAMLNTVERYWRAANQAFKTIGGSTMKQLRACWIDVIDGARDDAAFQRRHNFSKQFRRFMFNNPQKQMIVENDVKRRAYQPQPPIDLRELAELLELDQDDEDPNFDLLFAYFHYLNSSRINGPVKNYSGMVISNAPPFDFDVMWPKWRKILFGRLKLLQPHEEPSSSRGKPKSSSKAKMGVAKVSVGQSASQSKRKSQPSVDLDDETVKKRSKDSAVNRGALASSSAQRTRQGSGRNQGAEPTVSKPALNCEIRIGKQSFT
jgi:hypothetical protein